MATNAAFIATPRVDTVNIATANTNKDGTGTITTLVTGATSGTRILEIVTKATVTTAAGTVGIYLTTDSGTTWRLFDEIVQSATTSGTTTASNRTSRIYPNLLLKDSTQRIGVATTISQSLNVISLGGDL